MTSGFLLINKPSGPTSHDIIYQLRKITGIKKIGHAGTLDPFASGLLIIGIGRESTRQLDKFLKLDKEYIAVLQLGATSDTYDREGKINKQIVPELVEGSSTPPDKMSGFAQTITEQQIEEVLEKFRGELDQVPPMYSAKKVKGKKLYELARKGIEIERAPNQVKILELRILNYEPKDNILTLRCRVSSGTYIRSLAHDIGRELGIGAYLQELQRTSIGAYALKAATDIKDIKPENWQSLLKDLP